MHGSAGESGTLANREFSVSYIYLIMPRASSLNYLYLLKYNADRVCFSRSAWMFFSRLLLPGSGKSLSRLSVALDLRSISMGMHFQSTDGEMTQLLELVVTLHPSGSLDRGILIGGGWEGLKFILSPGIISKYEY